MALYSANPVFYFNEYTLQTTILKLSENIYFTGGLRQCPTIKQFQQMMVIWDILIPRFIIESSIVLLAMFVGMVTSIMAHIQRLLYVL